MARIYLTDEALDPFDEEDRADQEQERRQKARLYEEDFKEDDEELEEEILDLVSLMDAGVVDYD